MLKDREDGGCTHTTTRHSNLVYSCVESMCCPAASLPPVAASKDGTGLRPFTCSTERREGTRKQHSAIVIFFSLPSLPYLSFHALLECLTLLNALSTSVDVNRCLQLPSLRIQWCNTVAIAVLLAITAAAAFVMTIAAAAAVVVVVIVAIDAVALADIAVVPQESHGPPH